MQFSGEDDGLLQAIEQTIDALTFAQTHVVDADFRAHSKTTVESVLSLQEEQRNRVDAAFRAIPASPQFLSQHLLQVYRGEAASLLLAREDVGPTSLSSGDPPNIIDEMSDHQVKAFKKEMKQRIHEWEGAFRDANGREAAPQDKTTLRPIYELYKHAKNRVMRVESAATLQSTAASQQQPYQPSSSQRGTTSTLLSQLQTNGSNTTPGAAPLRSTSALSTSGTSGYYPSTPDRQTQPPAATTGAPHHQGLYQVSPMVSASNGRISMGSTTTTNAGSSSTVSTVGPASSPAVSMSTANTFNVTPMALGQSASLEDLVQEKRRIKRQLHQFEASFEQRYGRKPTRDDRKEFSREYHRYGELKALLNEHAKAGDD